MVATYINFCKNLSFLLKNVVKKADKYIEYNKGKNIWAAIFSWMADIHNNK